MFTRRTATASIGPKPMRLAMHHTRQKCLQFPSCLGDEGSPTANGNTSCPDDYSSSTDHSIQQHQPSRQQLQIHSIQQQQLSGRRLQLHSIQQHQPSRQTSAQQHTATLAVQTTEAPQRTYINNSRPVDNLSSIAYSNTNCPLEELSPAAYSIQ